MHDKLYTSEMAQRYVQTKRRARLHMRGAPPRQLTTPRNGIVKQKSSPAPRLLLGARAAKGGARQQRGDWIAATVQSGARLNRWCGSPTQPNCNFILHHWAARR